MKRKSSDRYEAARDKVVPAAEDFVQSAADRIGPLVHDAADRVGPLAHSAADRVGPMAQSAAERVGPLAQSAADRVSPYAHQAADFVGPYAKTAKKRGAKAAHEAMDKIGPYLDDALDRVGPAVEAARGRVQDDLLPRLSDALNEAAASPVAVEATKRGKATAAALKGELALPQKKKGRWIKRLAIFAAIGGIAAIAAKKLLGSKDDGWQAARPATSYGSTPKSTPASAKPVWNEARDKAKSAAQNVAKTVTETAETVIDKVSDVADKAREAANKVDDADSPIEDAVADAAAAAEAVVSDEDEAADGTVRDSDRSKYQGEGVYVGSEPPEGFTIKGNERSMKYHTTQSAGYVRTIAEVWFNSEEAAQEAGFVRAQR